MDACISLRKTYNAVLNSLTVNRYMILLFSSLPQIYILCYMIYNSAVPTAPFIYSSYMNGTGFSIFAALLIGWILATVSICKIMPNLLSVSIFIYKCLAHWALVSFIIILFYLSSYLGLRLTGYLSIGFAPPILLLLFVVDILRTSRTKMYEQLETIRQQIKVEDVTNIIVGVV